MREGPTARDSAKVARTVLVVVPLLLGLSLPGVGVAQDTGVAEDASAEDGAGAPSGRAEMARFFSPEAGPVEVRAERLIVNHRQKWLRYRGDVVVTQGAAALRCEQLTLGYDEGQEIEGGSCEGSARFEQGERSGRADEIAFTRAGELLKLTGAVRVEEGTTRLEGERAVLYGSSERVTVEGSPACTQFQPGHGNPAPDRCGRLYGRWGVSSAPAADIPDL